MDWGRGLNVGPQGHLDTWLRELAEELRQRMGQPARPPSLIGWSLGGLYARELAKTGWPVRQVITIGTPFNGRPEHTHAGWLYRWLNGAPALLDEDVQQRLRTAPPVPTTSIYSRGDGIVAWQACRHDSPGPGVQEFEICASHLGMGWNWHVLQIVGHCLADPAAGAGAALGTARAPDANAAAAAAPVRARRLPVERQAGTRRRAWGPSGATLVPT